MILRVVFMLFCGRWSFLSPLLDAVPTETIPGKCTSSQDWIESLLHFCWLKSMRRIWMTWWNWYSLEQPEDSPIKYNFFHMQEEHKVLFYLWSFVGFSLCPWVSSFSHTVHLDLVHSHSSLGLHSQESICDSTRLLETTLCVLSVHLWALNVCSLITLHNALFTICLPRVSRNLGE